MVCVLVRVRIMCRPMYFLGPTYLYSDSRLHPNPDPVAERMFLVSESSLVAALGSCPTCCAPCEVHQKSLKGTMVTCYRLCKNGHATTWHSQTQLQRMPIGNIKLASSIFASGASPTKVLRTMRAMDCPTMSLATYYNLQKHYIVNAVGNVFTSKQDVMLQECKQQPPLKLGGDARCDSPGHMAKYSSYSLMDLVNNKILVTELIQVHFHQ